MSDNTKVYTVMINPDDTKTVKIVHVAAESVRETEED